MELALSLGGDHSSNPFSNFQNSKTSLLLKSVGGGGGGGVGVGNTSKASNCMGLGLVLCGRPPQADPEEEDKEDRNDYVEDDHRKKEEEEESEEDVEEEEEEEEEKNNPVPVPVQQLDLLPFSPVPRRLQQIQPHSQFGLRFPWLVSSENLLSSEPGSSDGRPQANRSFRDEAVAAAVAEDQSSPNSAVSSFMEFTLSYNRNNNNKRPLAQEGIVGSDDPTAERGGASKGSDDENGSSGTRKKLRLSKDQSAFLEESFKEHHTLNPKQKLALAKQLNLRPRQVEVWFQNRRARTKLKQTEVDCEYLKRCCETLTEENRRLQKELQELRALKTTSHPFYMQHLPATTLTMCPSCERVATTSTNTNTNTSISSNNNNNNNITRPTSDGLPTTDLTLLSKPQQQQEVPHL